MELAEGRRIDRDDLQSESSISTAPPTPLGTSYLNELAKRFGRVEDVGPSQRQVETVTQEHSEDLEFRLFANGAAKAQKINLRSPTPPTYGSGRFRTGRHQAYYFTGESSQTQLWQYRYAAVTGQDIRDGLKKRWKGCELPWRVSIIQAAPTPNPRARSVPDPAPPGKRCRKGKKTRIAIRRRIARAEAAKIERDKKEVEKEVAEKEKRNARNREKKIKRRQKQRDAKASLKEDG